MLSIAQQLDIRQETGKKTISKYLDRYCDDIGSMLRSNEEIVKALMEYWQSVIYEAVTRKIEVWRMDEKKIAYLQMIQEPIGRMSTSSAIFKGFSATIVAGIASLSYKDLNVWVMVLSFLPVVAFALLDVYYLTLERRYRFLYERVLSGGHKTDFSMRLSLDKNEKKQAKARIRDCVKSPSIYLFYPLMIAVLLTICIFKMKGVI